MLPMKERAVDLALIAGLVVVAVVIVFTLFSPVPRRAPPPEPAVTQPSETRPPGRAAPGAEAPTSPTGVTPVPLPPEATAEDTAEGTAEPAAQPGEAAAEPATPLPEGATALERVGFSFAGVVGACNVELEPWVHVAVSRDILAAYPCGTEVTVTLDDEVAGRRSLRATVGDTMGPDASRTLNIYVAPDEPAGEYGVVTGRLGP
jgi:3D (Asp-Asp-Asp) domain-containing protein